MSVETDKDVGGRPTKYKGEDTDQLAYKLCLLGATNEQIAEVLDVNVDTVYEWQNRHESFSDALKRGKIVADAEIAQALYHRAKGYSHPDLHITNYQGSITETEITKHYPPDTGAAFIWLKNRAGWKDKQEHEHSVEGLTFNMNFGGKNET